MTDRRATADELSASESRSRTILESITDSFFSLDRHWRFVYANPAAERLLGRIPGDLLMKVLWDEYPGTVGSEIERLYRRVVAERVAGSVTAYYSDHDRWYEIRAYPAADGLSVYFRDVTESKRAEATLRASEQRRRLALDSAELGAWNIEMATEVLTSDDRFRTIFGGSTAAISYAEAFAAIHPDDRDRVRDGVAAAIRPHGPIPYADEYRVVHPDGAVRWVFAKGRANFDGDGPDRRLVSFDGTVADVTDRKRSEEQLKQSEERFRTLFNSIDEGFCVVEMMFDSAGRAADYRILEMNPAFERHTGLRGVIGRTAREFAPALEEFWYETYGRVATTGEPIRFVRDARALEDRWFDVYAFRLGATEDRKVAILFNDITARKRAEEQLRKAEEQFRTLADNIPQLAWIADAGTDGQVHWFNRSWLEYTGATLEMMQGSGWQAVHHPEHAERVISKFAYHVKQGLDWEDTFPLRGKDGEFRWFLSRMNVIRDESGAVARIFGTNTDITEQRETAEALRQLASDLSEADRRKNEFLAMLAHELRNPLAPISNALRIMRLAGGNANAVDSASAMMERQIGQMVRLVDDLLDVSRVSRGKIELRTERIDLASIVDQAVDTVRPLAESMGHELVVTHPTEPIHLKGDPVRLAQALGNLLNNGCKYTIKPSVIAVTVERESEQAVIRVRDNGIGIARDQLPRIFEMFTQLDTSLERSHSGLGIGLTLVKKLVEMHGGTVQAHSEGLGHGSEFVVRLPVEVELMVESSSAVIEAPGAPISPRRILVVDDNRDAATSLAMLLDIAGNETRIAHDGLEAVQVAATFDPDVVLLDIGMPKLNGYEAARRIRELPGGTDMALVALTGWGQDDDRRKSKEAGFDDHMVKPVDHTALINLLTELSASRLTSDSARKSRS